MAVHTSTVRGQLMEGALQQLKSIKAIVFSEPFFSTHSGIKNWNAQIDLAIKTYDSALRSADSPKDVFLAMANLEKNCSKIINTVLAETEHDKKLAKISDRLDALNALNEVIKNINLSMSQHIDTVIQDGLENDPENPQWKQLVEISQHIEINTALVKGALGGNQQGIANLEQIAQRGSKLILAALMKEMYTEKGREFISQMHSSLQNGKRIIVQPSVTTMQPGMAVGTVDMVGPFAQVETNKNSDTSIESRVDAGVFSSKGGSSALDVPITIPEFAFDNLGAYMAMPEIVEDSLPTLMGGDFYFNNNQITYVPFQVELYHELIHILHNAEGNNYRHVPLTKEEKDLWHTYEEYVTIKGGAVSEADFAPLYGTKPREDHSGLSTSILFNPMERNPEATIGQFIQKNSHQPHDHHHQLRSTIKISYTFRNELYNLKLMVRADPDVTYQFIDDKSLKGGYLKQHILEKFGEELKKYSGDKDTLEAMKKELLDNTPEGQILKQGQNYFTNITGIKTDSVKALDKMVEEFAKQDPENQSSLSSKPM